MPQKLIAIGSIENYRNDNFLSPTLSKGEGDCVDVDCVI